MNVPPVLAGPEVAAHDASVVMLAATITWAGAITMVAATTRQRSAETSLASGLGLAFAAVVGFLAIGARLIEIDDTTRPVAALLLLCALVPVHVAARDRLVPLAAVIAGFALGGLAWPLLIHALLHGGLHSVGGVAVAHVIGGGVALGLVSTIRAPGAEVSAPSSPVLALLGALLALGGVIALTGPDGATATLAGSGAGGVVGVLALRSFPSTLRLGVLVAAVFAGAIATGAAAWTPTSGVVLGAVAATLTVALLWRAPPRITESAGFAIAVAGAGVIGLLAPIVRPAAAGAPSVELGQQLIAIGLAVPAVLCGVLVGMVAQRLGGRATTAAGDEDALDLVAVMEEHARTGELTSRPRAEPYTEAGRIAVAYGRVLETVGFATARTESLVRTSADGLLTFNAAGLVTSANPGACAMFGLDAEEFEGVSVLSLITAIDGDARRRDLPALLDALVGRSREVTGRRRAGDEFIMEARFEHVVVGEDEIFAATMRDITERKRTEAKLASAEAEVRRRMERELQNAAVMQSALLPGELELPDCEIAKHFVSASETGGDWLGYDYQPESRSLTLCIGDVTGHGLASALMSAVVCGAFYAASATLGQLGPRGRRNPETHLRALADAVNLIVRTTGKGNLLMTMVFVHVQLDTGHVVVLNASHNAPLLIRDREARPVMARGHRLGDLERPVFELRSLTLATDDVLLLYTDGLLENTGPDGKVFAVRELRRLDGATATEVRDGVLRRAQEVWQGHPPDDDCSLLVFRYTRREAGVKLG